MTFDQLNLNASLLKALEDLGFTEPTPIQHQAFSTIMSGRDVVGIAQTGTGKTFAYLLPTLRQLTFSKQKEPRILILAPTRELAIQLEGEAKKLCTYMTVRVECVYGGTNINTQKIQLMNGVDVLVATPGRLLDLVLTNAVSIKHVKHLVIDEVDEMLDLGFRPQLTRIFEMMSSKRQNLLFSATMTEEVDAMINEYFRSPITIEVMRSGTPLERIDQKVYMAPNFYTKINLLEHLLATDESMQKVLIFAASKKLADIIHKRLEDRFPEQFEIIHGNKSQNFRMNAVASFEKGLCRGLIATDIMARGLDVTDVTHVININTPDDPETYIHRIGRTGRADSDGSAVLFVAEYEQESFEAIEQLMEKEVTQVDLPEEVVVSDQLLEEERYIPTQKNYLPEPTLRGGGFHEKLAKNKKVNMGNRRLNARLAKYKKPIKRAAKRKGKN